MLRFGSTPRPVSRGSPLRFAHSSGALPLDQAARDACRAALAAVGRPPVVLQAMNQVGAVGPDQSGLWAAEAVATGGGRSIVAAEGGAMDRARRIGAEVIETPLGSGGVVSSIRNAGRLKRLIEEQRVDIVHARDRDVAKVVSQAVAGTRARLITSCGRNEPFLSSDKDGGALADGDCIIAGSAHVRDVIAKAHPDRAERIAVIPDGVDVGQFAPEGVSAERISNLARTWGMLEEPALTVLAPGDIAPLRGQQVLAQALAVVGKDPRFQELTLIFAGTAPPKSRYAEKLASLARRGAAKGRVFIAGDLEDLPAAMMLSDIVVSIPEAPLGQDPMAAAAASIGKPVVGMSHGATAEVVLDGETGRLAGYHDGASVAAAIRDILLKSSEERASMAEAARRRAAAYFSNTAAALATVRLYGALLAGSASD